MRSNNCVLQLSRVSHNSLITDPVKYDDNRILGIELTANQHTILLISCYLPYECDMNYDDYCFYLDKFKCTIESASTPYVFILGDFNANIQSRLSLEQNLLSSVT